MKMNNKIRFLFVLSLVISMSAYAHVDGARAMVSEEIWVQPLMVLEISEDVSEEEAVDAMLSKAAELNLAVVAVHRAEYVTTVEFCAPSVAKKILAYNPMLAVYVPCRVSVIDRKIMTMDLRNVLQTLPAELQQLGAGVIQRVGAVMEAGVNGDF